MAISYTLNKKVAQKTKLVVSFVHHIKHNWFIKIPLSLWQMKDQKYNIHLCSMRFKPITSGFLDLSSIHCSILTSGNFVTSSKVHYMFTTIKLYYDYIQIFKLTKDSIPVFWSTIFSSDKLYQIRLKIRLVSFK